MSTLITRYAYLCVLAWSLGLQVELADGPLTVRRLFDAITAAIRSRGGSLRADQREAAGEAGCTIVRSADGPLISWIGWHERELDYSPCDVPAGVDPTMPDPPRPPARQQPATLAALHQGEVMAFIAEQEQRRREIERRIDGRR